MFPLGNQISENHHFEDINAPKECQKKCQESSECEIFVVHDTGRWKGCWLKTNGEKSEMSTQKATVGPKYCEGKSYFIINIIVEKDFISLENNFHNFSKIIS